MKIQNAVFGQCVEAKKNIRGGHDACVVIPKGARGIIIENGPTPAPYVSWDEDHFSGMQYSKLDFDNVWAVPIDDIRAVNPSVDPEVDQTIEEWFDDLPIYDTDDIEADYDEARGPGNWASSRRMVVVSTKIRGMDFTWGLQGVCSQLQAECMQADGVDVEFMHGEDIDDE